MSSSVGETSGSGGTGRIDGGGDTTGKGNLSGGGVGGSPTRAEGSEGSDQTHVAQGQTKSDGAPSRTAAFTHAKATGKVDQTLGTASSGSGLSSVSSVSEPVTNGAHRVSLTSDRLQTNGLTPDPFPLRTAAQVLGASAAPAAVPPPPRNPGPGGGGTADALGTGARHAASHRTASSLWPGAGFLVEWADGRGGKAVQRDVRPRRPGSPDVPLDHQRISTPESGGGRL